MQESYNILQALYLSFYSKSLYREVAKRWDGLALLHLLFLAACIAVFFIYLTYSVYQTVANDEIISQVPTLVIKEGVIQTPEARPYRIQDPQTQATLIMIDTTGQYQTLEDSQSRVLVTSTEIISEKNDHIVEAYQIPKSLTKVIDRQLIDSFLNKVALFFMVVLYFVYTFLCYVFLMVISLICGLIGMLMIKLKRYQLTFWQTWQVAMVALTPAVIITILQQWIAFYLPYDGWLRVLLVLGYLYYAIRANKDSGMEHMVQ